MRLFHATAIENMDSIMSRGIDECCYLTSSPEQAAYYCETIEEEGKASTIVELDLADLLANVDVALIYPDGESLAEPITSTLNMSDHEVQDAWRRSSKTWQDSLDIVRSIKCDAAVPAHILRCDDYLPPLIAASRPPSV
jgi:hypothetical protein